SRCFGKEAKEAQNERRGQSEDFLSGESPVEGVQGEEREQVTHHYESAGGNKVMAQDRILINRAPVLTLWAAVVAERLGFDRKEGLSLGKAVAGLTAQSKGRRLGIFTPSPAEVRKAREQKRNKEFFIEICGRHVPAINTTEGIRALNKAKPVEPAAVERYLEGKFGE